MEWIATSKGDYKINIHGLIRNEQTMHILRQSCSSPRILTHPYYKVTIANPKTSLSVHRELAIAFIPNPENKQFVDHINGNTLDNRVENLRWCSPQQNTANSACYSNNALNVKGVQKRNNGRYRARIRFNGSLISLGTFNTCEEASQAYINKSIELFGEFACYNR